MKDETRKVKLYTRRGLILSGIKALLLSSTIFRFYYLQIVDGVKYRTLSNNNRIRVIPIPAPRGKLLDRSGAILAQNIKSFSLQKNSINEEEFQQVGALLADDQLEFPVENFNYANLSWDQLARISANSDKLEGFEVMESRMRSYPYHELLGHITGYIGKTAKTRKAENYYPDLKQGITGVENSFEDKLKGQTGQRQMEVNAQNRTVRLIQKQNSLAGQDLRLSIDARLHEKARDLLGDKQGSIIVSRIDTGETLCLYSQPNYDPNMFIKGFSHEQWQEIRSNPARPLVNKAISAIYPPGSIFKMIPVLAALGVGFDPNQRYFCSGKHKVGNRTFHCWNRLGHGSVKLDVAIQKSCNIYLYKLAEICGIANIHKVAKQLDLIGKTGIELPTESNCFVPTKDWKRRKIKQEWVIGDTINSAIGQGYVTMTPIGMNMMTARIASGRLIKPTILCSDGAELLPEFAKTQIPESHLDIVRNALYMTTNAPGGTNFRGRLRIKNFELSGKTGTAQVVSLDSDKKLEDHSIFSGFAPYKEPKYAITVLVEYGSWGSKAAAPIASKMMKFVHQILEA